MRVAAAALSLSAVETGAVRPTFAADKIGRRPACIVGATADENDFVAPVKPLFLFRASLINLTNCDRLFICDTESMFFSFIYVSGAPA